jgi:hypothetical protein
MWGRLEACEGLEGPVLTFNVPTEPPSSWTTVSVVTPGPLNYCIP